MPYGTGSFEVHIPKPVFTVEVEYDPNGLDNETGEHVAKISAAGVVLHEERFSSQYVSRWNEADGSHRVVRPANYVHDEDSAADEAIAHFGQRLLALFGGETK